MAVEDVLEIHAAQLDRFGGAAGVRSLELLESAVAQPEASFGGAYLHFRELAAMSPADDR